MFVCFQIKFWEKELSPILQYLLLTILSGSKAWKTPVKFLTLNLLLACVKLTVSLNFLRIHIMNFFYPRSSNGERSVGIEVW